MCGDKQGPASGRGDRGFTAVEVLIAMTVMFIGAAAVMAMQKTSVTANLDARKADVAANIARTWVERLRRDAMAYTQPSASNAASNLPASLKANLDSGAWFRPTADMLGNQGVPGPVENVSYAFDILGRDLAATDIAAPNVQFCAEARLTTLVNNPAAANAPVVIRADVRVLWPRGIPSVPTLIAGTATGWPCSNAAQNFGDAIDYSIYHAVYLTTAIEENAAE
jgi:prepilin-type N-terminal cleavage/methylation domain-containing protein